MRLSKQQVIDIKNAVVEIFGSEVAVSLFGSRIDDSARGGDIDLLLEIKLISPELIIDKKLALLKRLYQRLGERKIDIIIAPPNDPRPIVSIARASGCRL